MFSVAYGACIQAAVLAQEAGAQPIYVPNVTALTIGITSGKKGHCCPLIKKNTPYPFERKCLGETTHDNQTKAKLTLYEGEHPQLKNNRVLGSTILSGLISSPKGNEIVDISVKIDEKAMISVTAVDRNTKNETKLDIVKPQQFSGQAIAEMVNNIDSLQKGMDIIDLKKDFKLTLEPIPKRIKIENEEEEVDDVCPIYGRRVDDEIYDHIELSD